MENPSYLYRNSNGNPAYRQNNSFLNAKIIPPADSHRFVRLGTGQWHSMNMYVTLMARGSCLFCSWPCHMISHTVVLYSTICKSSSSPYGRLRAGVEVESNPKMIGLKDRREDFGADPAGTDPPSPETPLQTHYNQPPARLHSLQSKVIISPSTPS